MFCSIQIHFFFQTVVFLENGDQSGREEGGRAGCRAFEGGFGGPARLACLATSTPENAKVGAKFAFCYKVFCGEKSLSPASSAVERSKHACCAVKLTFGCTILTRASWCFRFISQVSRAMRIWAETVFILHNSLGLHNTSVFPEKLFLVRMRAAILQNLADTAIREAIACCIHVLRVI